MPEPAPPPDLITWILTTATAHDDLAILLTGLCERLDAAGLPLWRASLDLPTLDPSARAITHKWWRDQPAMAGELPHGPEQEAVFHRSVIYHALSRRRVAERWRVEAGEGVAEFELLATLAAAGVSDYLLRLATFGDPDTAFRENLVRGAAFSFATDRAGGFTDGEIALLDALLPALGLAAYRVSAALTARNALRVYLGPAAAERVLEGRIRRGQGERIAAAILFADLKGFTALSEREDSLRVVGWLDEHFEAIGAAVTAQGGEILKFLGDGLLVVFPVADVARWPCPGCEGALRGAKEAASANAALNARRLARGEPALELDVALHYGEVVYGNVGASRRLDFTVIGRAVNEASRMEALCDEIGRGIVLSDVFARRCATPAIAVGEFTLRGLAGRRTIYAPQTV